MGVNRVDYGSKTLIDLTGDTVVSEVLQQGYRAHGADGEVVTGTLEISVPRADALKPYREDLNSGTITTGAWNPENPTNTYADEYQVVANHRYFLTLGGTVGNRFRVLFTTQEVSQAIANISGTSINMTNNPAAYSNVTYTPASDGYISVVKSNTGVTGIKTYMYDMTGTWE